MSNTSGDSSIESMQLYEPSALEGKPPIGDAIAPGEAIQPSRAEVWCARYDMLDAWRGLAATAVVVQHLSYQNHFPAVGDFWLGHWAVMLFFVISGYCITAAATSCLKKGLGFRQFMWRRIRRIYPPYLLAVGYFTVTRLIKIAMLGSNQLPPSPLIWLQNLTLTQWFSLVWNPKPVAADNSTNFVAAYWSLNYEEQFYLVMALLIVMSIRFKRPILNWALPLIALGFVWNYAHPYLSYGIFIEYWAHFGVGILLFYRLCRMRRTAHRRLTDTFFVVLALASVGMRWFAGVSWTDRRPLGSELLVVSVFALLLIVVRPYSERFMNTRAGKSFAMLGAISYSLYLIHQCNIYLAAKASSYIVPPSWAATSLVLQIVIHIGLAVPFYLLCERPFHNKALVEPLPEAIKVPPEQVGYETLPASAEVSA